MNAVQAERERIRHRRAGDLPEPLAKPLVPFDNADCLGPRSIGNLALVCCHFNPCRYQKPIENYFRFREGIEQAGVGHRLVTVELVLDDDPISIPEAIHVYGRRDRNWLWQKEALLNIGIRQIDRWNDPADAIAWLDADVLFDNPEWYAETMAALEKWPVVQMFESALALGPNGSAESKLHPSLGKTWSTSRSDQGHPGYAWAARRETIAEGLHDVSVLGDGDVLMAAYWCGTPNRATFGKLPAKLAQAWADWGARAYLRVQGNVGFVRGQITHQDHGSREHRKYVGRADIFLKHRFNPAVDLIREPSGIWAWSGVKPQMEQEVREWFEGRDEDRAAEQRTRAMIAAPSVTCVMLTGLPGRRQMAIRSIDCFRRQSYTNRELLILNTSGELLSGDALRSEDSASRLTIREMMLSPELERWQLRNIGIEEAQTDYVLQWDDDDIHGEDRIKHQVEALKHGPVNVLKNEMVYVAIDKVAFVASAGRWRTGGFPGTILHPRDIKARYPNEFFEDTAFLLSLDMPVHVIDNDPRDYLRMYHGANVCGEEHFRQFLQDSRSLTAEEEADVARSLDGFRYGAERAVQHV